MWAIFLGWLPYCLIIISDEDKDIHPTLLLEVGVPQYGGAALFFSPPDVERLINCNYY